MKIEKSALAGTLESCDVLVKVEPSVGLHVSINSTVIKQFGRQIRAIVMATLCDLNISDGLISIEDRGALDCVIKARVQCAVLRAVENSEVSWNRII